MVATLVGFLVGMMEVMHHVECNNKKHEEYANVQAERKVIFFCQCERLLLYLNIVSLFTEIKIMQKSNCFTQSNFCFTEVATSHDYLVNATKSSLFAILSSFMN